MSRMTAAKPVLIVGIDPSSKKLALTATNEDTGLLEMTVHVLPTSNRIKANGDAFRFVTEYLKARKGLYDVQGFLEEPVFGRGGPWPTIIQSYINGSIQAAFDCAGVDLATVNNMTWKFDVLGKRLEKKLIPPRLKEIWRQAYDEAARVGGGFGSTKHSGDLVDSACINRYGFQVLERLGMITRQGFAPPKKKAPRKISKPMVVHRQDARRRRVLPRA